MSEQITIRVKNQVSNENKHVLEYQSNNKINKTEFSGSLLQGQNEHSHGQSFQSVRQKVSGDDVLNHFLY